MNPPAPHCSRSGPGSGVATRHNWKGIDSLEGAKEMKDANAGIFALIMPPAEESDAGEESSKSGGGVQAVFDDMLAGFKADAAAGVDVVFQFNISGIGGGDWYSVIKDGACSIDPGSHEKPACTLKMAAPDFLAMMGGKLPAMQAFTSGKLQIEGDVMKSQLLEKLFVIG